MILVFTLLCGLSDESYSVRTNCETQLLSYPFTRAEYALAWGWKGDAESGPRVRRVVIAWGEELVASMFKSDSLYPPSSGFSWIKEENAPNPGRQLFFQGQAPDYRSPLSNSGLSYYRLDTRRSLQEALYKTGEIGTVEEEVRSHWGTLSHSGPDFWLFGHPMVSMGGMWYQQEGDWWSSLPYQTRYFPVTDALIPKHRSTIP